MGNLEHSTAPMRGCPQALVETTVDGVLDKPVIDRDGISAVAGSAQDTKGVVDVGDVAWDGVSVALLKENR